VGTTLLNATIPRRLFARVHEGNLFPLERSEQKSLTGAAIDAARRAGALYADVHIRTTRREIYGRLDGAAQRDELNKNPEYELTMGFGVRALVNGYWGYAGLDGVITTDAAAKLGRDATAQATVASKGTPREVELAKTPVVTGEWTMPVEIDPFTVSYEEKHDVLSGMNEFAQRLYHDTKSSALRFVMDEGSSMIKFTKDERTFASSDGSFTVQTVYCTEAGFLINVPQDWLTEKSFYRTTSFLSFAGAGWEYIRTAPFRDHAMRLIEDGLGARRPKPVDIGRYDVVFDAYAMAGVLSRSIGIATQLPRAMGMEANNGGTSYLSDPLAMLGTFKVGSPLLNVTADRSAAGGAATVKWDDEGVEPQSTALVTDGVLTDYQTTRESASWLAPYYQKIGKPVRSTGSAYALGTRPMTTCPANLTMRPGARDVSFEELVKNTTRGLAVVGGRTQADFQMLNGYGTGELVYQITNGKLGDTVANAEYIYRAPEFWKNLVAIGGPASAGARGFEYSDWDNGIVGAQTMVHTVSAVPAKITGVSVVDASRKG